MENIMNNVIDSSDFFANDGVELFARSPKSKTSSKIGKTAAKTASKTVTKSRGGKGGIFGLIIFAIIVIIIVVIIVMIMKKNKGKKQDKIPKIENEGPEAVVVENEGQNPYPATNDEVPKPDISQAPPMQYPPQGYYPPPPPGPYPSYPPTTQGYPPATQGYPPATQGYPPQVYLTTTPLPGTQPPPLTNFATTESVNPDSINAIPKAQ